MTGLCAKYLQLWRWENLSNGNPTPPWWYEVNEKHLIAAFIAKVKAGRING